MTVSSVQITFDFRTQTLGLARAENGQIALDGGLGPSSMISLLTNAPRQAGDSTKEDGGWWGDSYREPDDPIWGSRLYALRGARILDLRDAETKAHAALAWQIRSGAVTRHEITASYPDNADPERSVILLRVVSYLGDDVVWDNITEVHRG